MPFFQSTIPPIPRSTTLTGQVAVVTGATSGIGHELCLQLLQLGLSHLIIGVRSLQSGADTRLKLLSNSNVREANVNPIVSVLHLDLARLRTVARFTEEVLELVHKDTPGDGCGGRLDLLILNAGINRGEFERNVDGNELCMQVNFLSNSVLALRLLPVMQSTVLEYYSEGTPGDQGQWPTITFVGSMGHALHTPSPGPESGSKETILDYYASPEKYSSIRRYPDTKFFVGLFVRELSSHQSALAGLSQAQPWADSPVIVNNVCPGTVRTGADNELPWWLRIPMNINRALRGRSVQQGASAVLWAVCGGLHRTQQTQFNAEDGTYSNGFYIADNQIQELAPYANTTEGRDFSTRLWQEILEQERHLATI